jgi:hypothetical protein
MTHGIGKYRLLRFRTCYENVSYVYFCFLFFIFNISLYNVYSSIQKKGVIRYGLQIYQEKDLEVYG